MQARAKIIKESHPLLMISIHQNFFSDKNRRGAQTFYRKGQEECKNFANCVQKQLNGLKDNARDCSSLAGDYYLLNISDCPAVIVECGFLSNAEDEKLLISDNYQNQLSNAIFYGALQFLVGE